METKIDVLDHGFVRLVDWMGSDLAVARAARQSYDAAWRAGEDEGSDARLIRYLMRNHHTTPFEAVELQFEVKAPIFVFRQWVRHRTWSYLSINEVSARYRELPAEFYAPAPEDIGVQSATNKQGRDIEEPDSWGALQLRRAEVEGYENTCRIAFGRYRSLLDAGWPRELARMVLPLSTYSDMMVKVDLHNFFGWMTLRSDPHAQREIRVYAAAMLKLIRPVVPVCTAAWEEIHHATI